MNEEMMNVVADEVMVEDSTEVAEVSESGINGGAVAIVGLVGAAVIGGTVAGYKKFIAPKFTPDAKIERLQKKIDKQMEKKAKAEEESEETSEVKHKKGFISIPIKKKDDNNEK